MAGNVKRERISAERVRLTAAKQEIDEGQIAASLNEQEILIQSIMESFVPRLISEDLPLLQSLLNDVFPGIKYEPIEIARLKNEIKKVFFCNNYKHSKISQSSLIRIDCKNLQKNGFNNSAFFS